MRSQQGLKKVWDEIKINNVHCVKSHHTEYIIGILLYSNFIELPGSNQTFEKKQGHFKLSRARQAREKNHATS